MDFATELSRVKPDYVVYKPGSTDGATHDTGNEHFLVFDGPDGSLMAVWTQSTCEGMEDQRIVFATSLDEGVTWTDSKTIAGAVSGSGRMASWGFPMVSLSGRIYVIYNKHIGVNDVFTHTTGLMAGIYSDDCGQSWSAEVTIPMRRSKWDHPDGDVPANWIVWQKPQRLSDDKYLVGFTRWVSAAVAQPNPAPNGSWIGVEAVVEFMRFENLDEDPSPSALEIRWIASDDHALRVPYPGHPDVSVVQEPSIVALPDGRLFSSLRTTTGSPYFTVSADGGLTWSSPKPIKQSDTGELLRHPLSPCPIYSPAAGKYILFLHDHDGNFRQWTPTDTNNHRRPVYAHVGTFDPAARLYCKRSRHGTASPFREVFARGVSGWR